MKLEAEVTAILEKEEKLKSQELTHADQLASIAKEKNTLQLQVEKAKGCIKALESKLKRLVRKVELLFVSVCVYVFLCFCVCMSVCVCVSNFVCLSICH